MQVSANQTNARNDTGLEFGLREQQTALLSPARRPIPTNNQEGQSKTERAGSTPRDYAYTSYASKRNGIYIQAIRAYQEASRFEENGERLTASGNSVGKGPVTNEKTLTNILREEPTNSNVWAELGMIYHTEGNRDKVSTIYQVLQELDVTKAETFATQVGLREKMLFSVA